MHVLCGRLGRRFLLIELLDLRQERFELRCFAAEVAKFQDARITAYLPILIHRNARARLRAMEARPLRIQP